MKKEKNLGCRENVANELLAFTAFKVPRFKIDLFIGTQVSNGGILFGNTFGKHSTKFWQH